MKLFQLLAQFLYLHKKLELKDIGTFNLNTSEIAEADSDRSSKSEVQGIITFENNASAKIDDELISFISVQSGKMKALATADLESFLELAQQFLNIGKPFILEGIGTLSKNRDGQFSFTQGNFSGEKFKSRTIKEPVETVEEVMDFKSVFWKGPKKINWRKPAIALFILLGLGLVVMGGYLLYKKTSKRDAETTLTNNQAEETTLVKDSSFFKPDSISNITATNNSSYKFVLDQFKAPRAFERFNQLKTFGWAVQMETKDSVDYKLFMLLPVATTDTTKALDSLILLNGRRVYIEN